MLKLSRGEFNDIQREGIRLKTDFLKLYQMSKKFKPKLSAKEVNLIKMRYTQSCNSVNELINIAKKIPLRKAANYIEKQYKEYRKKYYSRESVAITWRDYISDCERLEIDIKNEYFLYPKDLYKAHQETIRQVKYKEDKELNMKIENRAKALEKYIFSYNGLLIRPVMNQKELIREGEKLKHCVGGYAKNYANALTNIFVIRKIDNEGEPYYTVEIKGEKIIQVQGYKHKSPEEDVKIFMDAFEKEMFKKSKRKGVA